MDSFSIENLRVFGFSSRLIQRWRETGASKLLPLQIKTVQDYGFLQGRNLLVLAPTSSGKTFVAEMAALKHLEAGRRVIYLVPTKALAEEKGRQFRRRYAPMNYRVAVATRERPETDRMVIEGRFDLLVAVYEKLKAYLVVRPELLNQLGLVVVDEVQTLGERGRGEGLDLLLGKINASPWRPQFIGLSAVLGEGGRLSDWLKCDLLLYRNRPVELREGVVDATSGVFRYRCVNSGEEGEEPLIPPDDGFSADQSWEGERLLALAQFLAEARAEQVLLFTTTRHQSRYLAAKLAEQVSLPAAEDAARELAHFEPTASRDLLLQCLRSGVGYHNADLSPDQRALIEEHYQNGSIRVLVSTSTLGQGVNLTGRNVIQIPQMASLDPWTGETTLVPLSIGKFRNHGGRAGRYQLEEEFGRSMLLASGPDEAERLFRRYVAGELEALTSPLDAVALDMPIMDYVASGLARDGARLRQMLFQTYTGFSEWRAEGSGFDAALDESLARLKSAKLIRQNADGLCEATGLGKVMAAQGLSRQSVVLFDQWLSALGKRLPQTFEALLVLCATADGQDFPVSLSAQERRQADYLAEARDRLAEEAELCPVLKDLLWPEGGLTVRQIGMLKKAFALEEWIGGRETADLEEQYAILAGSMANLAAHIHWLARALAEASQAAGNTREQRAWLARLADRLPLGLQEDALGLAGLHAEGVTRGVIHALVREGYDSLPALKGLREEDLARIIPPRVARSIIEEMLALAALEDQTPAAAADAPADQAASASAAAQSLSARLEIDENEPGRIRFDGAEINLTAMPWRLLVLLARQASKVVPRAFLVARLWPDGPREEQGLRHHYHSIVEAIAAVAGKEQARALLETRRGLGVRLVLPPERVRIVGSRSEG